MSIRYTIEEHAAGYPSKVLARQGGKHILNIQLKEDCDNTWFVGQGSFVELDLYEQAAPTTLTGVVRAKAENGNWLVEITSAANAFFVYQVPVIEEEFTKDFLKEGNFFNKQGSVVRAYELAQYDVVEISPKGFKGTVAAGDSVSLQAITGVSYAKQLGA